MVNEKRQPRLDAQTPRGFATISAPKSPVAPKPLARVAAVYRQDLPSSYRAFTMGPVWRTQKPGPSRFPQFYQCDADTLGPASVVADAEMHATPSDVLEAVGIARAYYIVRVSNRRVLNGATETGGIGDPQHEAERGIDLRAIDKLGRFGEEGAVPGRERDGAVRPTGNRPAGGQECRR